MHKMCFAPSVHTSGLSSDLDGQSTSQQYQQLTWSAVTAVAGVEGAGRGVRGAPQADRTTGLAAGAAAGRRTEEVIAPDGRTARCADSMALEDEVEGLG